MSKWPYYQAMVNEFVNLGFLFPFEIPFFWFRGSSHDGKTSFFSYSANRGKLIKSFENMHNATKSLVH